MTTTIELPPQRVRAAPVPQTWDPEQRTVEVMVSTGRQATQYAYGVGRYLETLDVTSSSCSLERLNQGANVVQSHDTWSLRSVIGVVERAWIEKGELRALIRLSDREDVAGIVRDIENGILRNFSVGYEVRAMREDTNPGDEVRSFTVTDWEPYELSVVSVPAEVGAGTRSAEMPAARPVAITQGHDMRNFGRGVVEPAGDQITGGGEGGTTTGGQRSGEQQSGSGGDGTSEPTSGSRAAQPAPATPPATSPDPAALETERARAVEQERQRAQAIEAHCDAIHLGADATRRLVRTGRALADLTDDIAREYERAHNDPEAGEIRHQIDVGTEERTKHTSAAAAALYLRMRPNGAGAEEAQRDAGEYAGRSILETIRLLEHGRGARNAIGLSRDELVTRGLHTTSDFPILFEEVGRRTLRDAYDVAPSTWRAWCQEGELIDFRPHSEILMGDAPPLEEIPAGGDIKYGSTGESKELIKLVSYGRGIRVDRRMIINDDLGALARMIVSQAQRVADLVSGLVYNELENGTVGGSGLFIGSRNNSGTTALSVQGLGELETLMADQKSAGTNKADSGMPLILQPKFLLVNTNLITLAKQLTTVINPNEAAQVNPYRGVLTPIVEPRLPKGTAYYVIADPAAIDTIVVKWLQGHQGPQFGMKEHFGTRGVEYAVWADVAVKAIDYRGLTRSTGASAPS